eukprot:TRINITY_DN11182_c0_g1_i1.p1 TRINITY_DN11182_c0_g1~~TRINITY_DN11182_c0_g1_i1.p1  ORF type:complete len:198 (+),score=44.47 TRINITY_DN11182_c0_g1_i1:35-595(+)
MTTEKSPTQEFFQASLQRLKDNDPTLVELNLNNLEDSTPETGVQIALALAGNTFLQTLQVVNCSITTEGARNFAEALVQNKTLTNLNLETNRITADGIKHLAGALLQNATLKELKLANQAQQIGSDAERELAKAVDANQVIQKLTLTGREAAVRNTIDRATMRNKETARKARQAQLAAEKKAAGGK